MQSTLLTVITPTWQRPQLLSHCIKLVRAQTIPVEHIVVSDGPDEQTKALCAFYGVTYAECPNHVGDYGNTARDIGARMAHSKLLAFWDDDNHFLPTAASVLTKTGSEIDVGVAQIQHWDRKRFRMRVIPDKWTGEFKGFHIDTACFCVSRSFFRSCKLTWKNAAADPYSADHQLCEQMRLLGARIKFQPTIIGTHI